MYVFSWVDWESTLLQEMMKAGVDFGGHIVQSPFHKSSRNAIHISANVDFLKLAEFFDVMIKTVSNPDGDGEVKTLIYLDKKGGGFRVR